MPRRRRRRLAFALAPAAALDYETRKRSDREKRTRRERRRRRRRLLHLRAASLDSPMLSVSAMLATRRETKRARKKEREGERGLLFPRRLRRPGSSGSCLAHKESSKSPFLPTFLPSSSRSCTSSKPQPPLLPSLFPFRVALAHPHGVPSSIPSALSRCPPAC